MSEGPQPTPTERREAIERATHTLLRAAERVRERTRLLVEIPRVSMTGSFHAADEDAAAWLAPFAENAVPRHDARVVLRFAERALASGPARFAELRSAQRMLDIPTEVVGAQSEAEVPPARAWLTASFNDTPDDGPWSGYPSGQVALPELEIIRHEGETYLGVLVDPGDAGVSERIRRAMRVVSDARSEQTPTSLAAAPSVLRTGGTPEAEYRAFVRGIIDGIRAGAFTKVVAARRLDIDFDGPLHPADALRALAFAQRNCVRFAWRWRGADGEARTFVGATPEHLLRLRGRRLETEALAGTVQAAVDPTGASLLESAKDRREHQMVVDYLREGLRDVCDPLRSDPSPSLRKLRSLIHLRTGVAGTLRDGVDAFALLERLHPTPAVGGLPQAPADAYIRANEGMARGGYAAPLGWVDERGDAEIVVALRSAVIRGARAHLYAGAGIVEASDPAAEYVETTAKLRAMSDALGLSDGALRGRASTSARDAS